MILSSAKGCFSKTFSLAHFPGQVHKHLPLHEASFLKVMFTLDTLDKAKVPVLIGTIIHSQCYVLGKLTQRGIYQGVSSFVCSNVFFVAAAGSCSNGRAQGSH